MKKNRRKVESGPKKPTGSNTENKDKSQIEDDNKAPGAEDGTEDIEYETNKISTQQTATSYITKRRRLSNAIWTVEKFTFYENTFR